MPRAFVVVRRSVVGSLILFIGGCGADESALSDPYPNEPGDSRPAPGTGQITTPPAPVSTPAEDTQPPEVAGNGLGTPPEPVTLPPGGAANDDEVEIEVAEQSDDAPPESDGASLVRGPEPTLQSASTRGPFDVETLTNGLRDGPDYGSQTLYYPTDAEPPFAGVVVVPGFVSPESSIGAWGPFLASHGIVTLTIGTNAPTDQPETRAAALLDAVETLKAEHARAGSPIEGKLDLGRFGVMGWSMGGGGTLIAANANPELLAALTLAAWSPGETFGDDRVPTLLLAGSADTLAGGQSQGFFASIPDSTPKVLFEVAGGSHSVANDPSAAGGEIGRFGLSWLKVFLEGDERYRQFLLQTPTSQSDFASNL